MTTDDPAQVRTPRISGLTLILIATGIAGIASYVITWLVPRQIGFEGYATFAVFWSFTYLLVGALSGIQQEVTRSTRPAERSTPRAGNPRNFGIAAALLVFAAVVVTATAWVGTVFPQQGWALILPLAVGASSYVLVAVLCGCLYGIGEWRPLALLLVTDALLRLAAISVTLAFTHDVVALAWATAAPFPLTFVAVWPFIRGSIVGRSALDVGYLQLAKNVGQTVVAASATGVMVSGFPLVLGLTSQGESKVVLGLYILCITLTRAPLIIVLMSLQSYLVVTFRNNTSAFGSNFVRVLSIIIGAGAVLAVAGWLAGPAVFALLFPDEPMPEGWFLATLVFSSALVGTMCVTGPAVLARSQHLVYSSGWISAAAVTVIMLVSPVDFTSRTILALLLGPCAGLAVHAVYLVRSRPPERSRPV